MTAEYYWAKWRGQWEIVRRITTNYGGGQIMTHWQTFTSPMNQLADDEIQEVGPQIIRERACF